MNDIEPKAAATDVATLPNAVDLWHHLNLLSRSRKTSPLKEIIKYMAQDGMISLAGGLPHPSLFPVYDASFTVSGPEPGTKSELKINNESTSVAQLSTLLQYGNCLGNADLRKFCLEFTREILQPAYKDCEVLLHPGNTNAWAKVVGLLCEKNEFILCESYTYPSAQALWIPSGCHAVPIAMDGQGIIDTALEAVMAGWNETHPGVKPPHVLYLVTVGSNPTGASMGAERRRKVYEVCVKYDVIIVEDDPYFFLQYPGFDHTADTFEYKKQSNGEYLASLVPSFLRFDYQGRVIRLESFSKTLAPGLRVGYFVCNAQLSERLLRATEVDTQEPSGLSQAVVLGMLRTWGLDGYVGWLQNLALEYQRRRDWMVGALRASFDLAPASAYPELRAEGLVAAIPGPDGTKVPVFSFIPPTAGMFIWCKTYLSQNPKFQALQKAGAEEDPEQTFANQLWLEWAAANVLVVPGYYYHPWQGADKASTKARGADPSTSHFRLAFSMTTKEQMEVAIERLATVIRKSWAA